MVDLITPGDDICYASQNRQNAVKDLARDNDLILIVGSHNSSNSLRMVEVARDHGAAAHLVPDEQHLDEAWLAAAVPVIAQLPFYPATDASKEYPSYSEFADGYPY